MATPTVFNILPDVASCIVFHKDVKSIEQTIFYIFGRSLLRFVVCV
jgi:hypothetical protein